MAQCDAGRSVCIGHAKPRQVTLYRHFSVELPGVDFLFEKKIQGSSMGSNRFRTDMPKYVDMYLNGKLNLDDLISGHIKLENVNEAFAQLETGEVARNIIMMS